MEAAGDFISSNTRIALVPSFITIIILPIVAWWAVSLVFLYSIGTPKYVERDLIASMELDAKTNYFFWYFLFGLFWLIAFFIALSQFTVGATTCIWYFSGQGSDDASKAGSVNVSTALAWAIKLHLGSLAFGSFLIACTSILKVVFEVIAKKVEKY